MSRWVGLKWPQGGRAGHPDLVSVNDKPRVNGPQCGVLKAAWGALPEEAMGAQVEAPDFLESLPQQPDPERWGKVG